MAEAPKSVHEHYDLRIIEHEGYAHVFVESGRRNVQFTVSPTGRSVRVYVDGEEVK